MSRRIVLICALLVALLGALAATALLVRPPPLRTATQAGQFDSSRAKERLATILGDERPHPADSAGDDAVRARLIAQIRAMRLTPVVRDQFACNEIYKQRGVSCARVRNVIVAVGPQGGKALLLNAHYDSSAAGPGAGDDGVGVATLLEVASILRKEPLKRPVIFLFNEGEELGLVGARAFLADPLSGRVDSLVNLEARGTTGPVTMFETSLPNGPPVRAFSSAVDRPFANSLATDFYRQLPNYTDVNSFSERGWTTLNFAMIGNETRYHSPGDTLAALDSASLQHMGDQALALARALSVPTKAKADSLLFADIAGRLLVVVPQPAGFVLLGLLVAGFAVIALRRGGAGRGLAMIVGALVLSAAIAWLGLYLVGSARPGSFWRAWPAWTHLAVYACGLLAAVATLATIGRGLAVEQLRSSFWLAFLLLGVAVFFVAPGGVIYFLFPPLAALLGAIAQRWLPWAERAGMIAAAVLLWLTFGEVLALLGQLIVNGPFFLFAPLAMLIAMPWLVEARPLFDDRGGTGAIAASAVLALLGWAIVAAAPAYSADRQQRFVIQHVTNAVSGRSHWLVVNDQAPLPGKFGGGGSWRWGEFPYLERKGWIAPAPSLPETRAPSLEVLSNVQQGKFRTTAFRIHANGAESVTLIGAKDSQITSFGSGDYVRPIAGGTKGRYFLQCFGRSCDGATMQLTTTARQRLGFTLVGSNSGLPESATPLIGDRPRFARPQYTPDSTLTISRIFL